MKPNSVLFLKRRLRGPGDNAGFLHAYKLLFVFLRYSKAVLLCLFTGIHEDDNTEQYYSQHYITLKVHAAAADEGTDRPLKR
jgi:hypothetical protein